MDDEIILETERLILRRLQPGDLDALYALYRDPEVRRHFLEGTLTFEQTKDELDWFVNGDPDHPRLGLWAALHKATGDFIGRCGLIPWTIDGIAEVEVAYLLDKRYWRQGLASEAARALVRYGFEELRLPRVIALIDSGHTASIGTAMKAGLRFEREVVMDGVRSVMYAAANTASA
jgi:ribosomal-protein-alanine N-acetyltransferase